jgi:sn-glycerol 3-phosphate transport system substrate-binding protein
MSNRRKVIRKAWPLLVTFGLLLALAACGGGGEESGGDNTATPGGSATPEGATAAASSATPASSGHTVEITMWHDNVAATLDAIEGLARRFNSSQSEVKVKLAFQGTDAEEMAKVVASMNGGDLPNIIQESESFTQRFIDSGAIVPVQEFVDKDNYDLSDLNKKAIEYYTVDGTLWAMPFGVVFPMLYYNKNVFRDVGLDPESPPKDFEEVREVSEKMLQRDAHGNVTRTGIAIDITSWLLEFTLVEHGDLYANNENGRAGRATEVLFNGPTGQTLFQWWHDMVEEDLAINVGRNPTYAETYLTLGAGRVGMATGHSSALRSVVDALEGGLAQTKVDLGVAHLPGVPGGTGLNGIGGRELWIVKSHPQEEQEASWKFIKWLMEPEQQAEWYARSSYLPVNLKAFELPAAAEIETKYPQFKVAAQLYLEAASSPELVLGALLGPYLDIADIVMRAVEEMLIGNKDPIAAINDAAKDANQIIEEYNRRIE